MVFPHYGEESLGDKLFSLLQDPFSSQVASSSILAATIASFSMTTAIIIAFCILRPRNEIVYAPRLRHADDKRKPPPMDRGLFAWVGPVFKTNETECVNIAKPPCFTLTRFRYMDMIGMDAAVFLRITRMCRNMFFCLAIVACAIILPVNLVMSPDNSFKSSLQIISWLTPINMSGRPFWAYVVCAYAFDIIICGFLWSTYRAIYQLRRTFMESPEYHNSLCSRTLMITDVARHLRAEQGIIDITASIKATSEVPQAAIGRNVKDIPELIKHHDESVLELEGVLCNYSKTSKTLLASRLIYKQSKRELDLRQQQKKADAIKHLAANILRLEAEIKTARETLDKRNTMPYGFASYKTIELAHTLAYAARGKDPKGASIQLAPRPKDVIWSNLVLDAKTRRWRRFINGLWIALLTVLYFIPNALIAVFLAQISNISLLWPEFKDEYERNAKAWSIVQGENELGSSIGSLDAHISQVLLRPPCRRSSITSYPPSSVAFLLKQEIFQRHHANAMLSRSCTLSSSSIT